MQAGVYTNAAIFIQGGYRYCTDDELSLLIGHEIAHRILSHWDEWHAMNVLSNFLQITMLPFQCARSTSFSSIIVDKNKYYKARRMSELESDFVGAFLAARSCYDVRFAPVKWLKLHLFYNQKNTFSNNIHWENLASTHPNHMTRAKQMEEILPLLLQERISTGCSELKKLDPREVFKEFQKYVFNQTEILDIQTFEKHFLDMISGPTINQTNF